MAALLISNGRVIDPATGRDGTADVAIRDGKVVEIGPSLSTTGVEQVIDAKGLIVAPGLIDPHVHLREPGQEDKETIASGARAAVAGGFTTVCCMPNTTPALDCPELIRFVYDRAREAACRVFPVGAGTIGRKGDAITEIGLMHEAGAVGFSDDGDVIASAGMMSRVLSEVAQVGSVFMQHCQEPTLTQGAVMHAGRVSMRFGLTGWPRVAEEVIIERDVRLNRAIGCRYHVQHLSSAGSVEIVRRARAEGQPVSAEASPHHLLLTDEAIDRDGVDGAGGVPDALAKVNPPIRERSDVDAVRTGVADGTITILATDHAPHTAHEKAKPIEEAPFGLIGLEGALGLYAKALVEPGLIDWPRLIALMTVNPAALCGLDGRGLGRLAVGGPADLTLIDPDCAWTLDAAALAGKSCNTPFLGWSLGARAVVTIVNGEVQHAVDAALGAAVAGGPSPERRRG